MKPNQKAKTAKKVQIREMFNKISVEYDFAYQNNTGPNVVENHTCNIAHIRYQSFS